MRQTGADMQAKYKETSLGGLAVHVVTVNDYLARRDQEWNGTLFEWLGLRTDCIDKHEPNSPERRNAYMADITYGTNNEFGFDYLRDNMVHHPTEMVQRKHHYAMVDEVDSVLIDDARTPLIISGPSEESTDKYYRINRIIPSLIRGEVIEGKEPGVKWTTGDYTVEERTRTVALTEEGVLKIERLLGLRPGGVHDLAHLGERLGVRPDQVYVNVDRYGNTSAASVPLALRECADEKRLHRGDIVVTVGFGAGLTWGANVIRWNRDY